MGMLEWRRMGGRAHGETPFHHLGRRTERQTNINMKYTMALDSRQSTTTAHTTTNQKQAAATERSMEGRCNEQDMWGKRDTIILGAL
jgi:hypothetical protein